MKTNVLDDEVLELISSGHTRIGRIVEITDDGRPVVDFPGNQIAGLIARSVVSYPKRPHVPADGIPVLLVFDDHDPCFPIVVGLVSDRVCPEVADRSGEELVLEASRQIVLRCGKSVITLRRDGKVVVRGAEVVTRASGRNKIRGTSVEIN